MTLGNVRDGWARLGLKPLTDHIITAIFLHFVALTALWVPSLALILGMTVSTIATLEMTFDTPIRLALVGSAWKWHYS